MCAIASARRGRCVVVIEHGKTIGSKILASGGGRCNFTNLNSGPENYISGNPHFVKSALSRFRPDDFMKMLDMRGIPYEEKKSGQLFCRRSARDVVSMLRKECLDWKVKILTGVKIRSVSRRDLFNVRGNRMDIESESLVVATGGLSYRSLGASDFGFRIARKFKIDVTELRPALVPLIFNRSDKIFFSALSGISFRGRVSCGKTSFADDILFTHRGLSGPAILQISSYWKKGDHISIDIFPETDIFSEMMMKRQREGRMLAKNFISRFIPRRFAEVLCGRFRITKSLASCTADEIGNFCENLHGWEIAPAGTEGFENAEATRGGVDTFEVSSKTMESSKVKGLHFIGEVLDVVGHLGGYNMHWAWASGHAAGRYA